MSNSGVYIVNLGKDPEQLELGGRQLYKLRVAEKAASKKAATRWFTALVGGPDLDTASRLKKGDSVALAGELALTEYAARKPRYNGEMVREDEMPFAKLLRVIKSPTFFAQAEATSGVSPESDNQVIPELEGL